MNSISKMPEHFTLVATGHRPEKLGGYGDKAYERLFAIAHRVLPVLNPERVFVGMALGWDTAVAEASLMLGIPYDAYIPFEGQESKWPRDAQRFYAKLVAKAANVVYCSEPGYSSAKMHIRNHRMVDDCHGNGLMGAMWDGGPDGGTAACLNYAEERGLDIMNFYPEWLKGAKYG